MSNSHKRPVRIKHAKKQRPLWEKKKEPLEEALQQYAEGSEDNTSVERNSVSIPIPALDLAGASRLVRLARGLKLREVAERLGFRTTSWGNIEYRDQNMGPGTIEALPQALGISMAWLAVLAISNPGPEGDPIARHIRAAQQLIRDELARHRQNLSHPG